MFGGKNNTTIDGSNNITYGVDMQGKMYIYNLGTNKMVYYGDPSRGLGEVYALQNEGNRIAFEGDQRKTNANAVQAPQSQTAGAISASDGSGYGSKPKTLDTAQLASLDSYLSTLDQTRGQARQKAALKKDASLNEKREEKEREEGKYNSKKLSTLQEFGGAKTDTDINTRNTLENLISSMSVLGLGGSKALTRQILDASNMANRKANATQATNNQSLDTAFNEFSAGNENDVKKINDQYGYDVGEADRKYYQDRQNTLYKKADVYNAADQTAGRDTLMRQGNDLNGMITGATFLNPSYTGETKAMATPELANYTQDIATYDTSNIGMPGGMTPVSAAGGMAPGNLAVRAIAVNDQDLGVKKKSEAGLGYGV